MNKGWLWRSGAVAWNGLKKMTRSVHFYVVIFFAVIFWQLFTWNLRGLAADAGYAVTPYLLPHFFANDIYRIYGLLMLILVTCDAPFLDAGRLYSVRRTGKLPWAFGKILYMIGANLVFQAVLFLSLMISLIPTLGFSGSWGSVLYTAANDPAALSGYSGYGSVSSLIVSGMTPFEAMGKQMLLCLLMGCFMGLVAFLINGITGRAVGPVLMAGAVLAADFFRYIDSLYGTGIASKFMFCWLNLENYIDGSDEFGVRIGILLLICAGMSAAACILVKKNIIRTTE